MAAQERRLAQGLVVLGVVFSLVLASIPATNMFFGGDGGLKYLLTKQIADGDWHVDMHLAGPAWAHDLWSRGLYPFSTSFAYLVDGRWYYIWPVFFSIVTAPFFAMGGYRGLYVVPLVALWMTWLLTIRLGRGLGLGGRGVAVAVGLLIFSSPLTLYGAQYCEHTLAVMLAVAAYAALFGGGGQVSRRQAALAGVLLGLTPLFRSELLVLICVTLLLLWVHRPSVVPWRSVIAFTAVCVSTVLCFVLWNELVYHLPFGLHSTVALTEPDWARQLSTVSKVTRSILALLGTYFPFIVSAVLCALLARRWTVGLGAGSVSEFLAAATVLFVALVLLILPHDGAWQLGPRYLLAVMPLTCVWGMVAAQALWQRGDRLGRGVAVAAVVVAAAWGGFKGSVQGVGKLQHVYATHVLPAYDFLQSDPAQIVAASHQYIPQEFAGLSSKTFFLTKTPNELQSVAAAAFENGDRRILFVAYPETAVTNASWSVASPGGPLLVTVKFVRALSTYAVHEVLITRG